MDQRNSLVHSPTGTGPAAMLWMMCVWCVHTMWKCPEASAGNGWGAAVRGGAAGQPDECVCFCQHLFPTHQMLIRILSCWFGTSLLKIIRNCIYNRWLLHDLPRYLRITNVPNSKIIFWNREQNSLLLIYCEFYWCCLSIQNLRIFIFERRGGFTTVCFVFFLKLSLIFLLTTGWQTRVRFKMDFLVQCGMIWLFVLYRCS